MGARRSWWGENRTFGAFELLRNEAAFSWRDFVTRHSPCHGDWLTVLINGFYPHAAPWLAEIRPS